ncbi:MAG: HNH endonuclease [Vibrio sp.]
MKDFELLNYNPESGLVYWSSDRNNKTKAGDLAGGLCDKGYVKVKVNGNTYGAHVIGWFLHYGVMPTGDIDHINGVRSDNRICNLRDVSSCENMKNKRLYKSNKSGVSGVRFVKSRNEWVATIGVNGKKKTIGYSKSFEEAKKLRLEAEIKYKYHKNHGKGN